MLKLLHKSRIASYGDSSSPLYFAAMTGDVEKVDMLLRYTEYTEYSGPDYLGHALIAATSEGHLDIVQHLVAHGARTDTCRKYYPGFSALEVTHPLREASSCGNTEILHHLLHAARSQWVQQRFYQEAYEAASRAGQTECVRLIRANRAEADRMGITSSTRDGEDAWYNRDLMPEPDKVLLANSRETISIVVRPLMGRLTIIYVRLYYTGIMVKHIIQDLTGLPITDIVLIVDKSFRRIKDDERLCDSRTTDDFSLHVTLPFKATTGCWVDPQWQIERALRLSAEEAGIILPDPPARTREKQYEEDQETGCRLSGLRRYRVLDF